MGMAVKDLAELNDVYRHALKERTLVPNSNSTNKEKFSLNYAKADRGSSCSAPHGKFIFRAGVGKSGSLWKLVSAHLLGIPKQSRRRRDCGRSCQEPVYNPSFKTHEASQVNSVLADI